ncbi:hypothetical protein [Jeongeupia sp. USM3]|uniref:hypothetical protein n=1 Tax=Jeongeupia sp. USM3 TaxID=1906741 RepID=UPI00089DEF6B|nr:hypothetical protein [Jeongeupia sp. USM3]AOY01486.1 hypothetical protein BJP62_14095 [Jeongeupia sp. USM3]
MRVRLLTLLLFCLALTGRGLPAVYAAAAKPVVCTVAGTVPAGDAPDCHDAPCCMPAALPATPASVPPMPHRPVEVAACHRPGCGSDAPAWCARDPPEEAISRAVSL